MALLEGWHAQESCCNNDGNVLWKVCRTPAMALSDVSVGLQSGPQGRSEWRIWSCLQTQTVQVEEEGSPAAPALGRRRSRVDLSHCNRRLSAESKSRCMWSKCVSLAAGERRSSKNRPSGAGGLANRPSTGCPGARSVDAGSLLEGTACSV